MEPIGVKSNYFGEDLKLIQVDEDELSLNGPL